jgi:hypothetical protein
MKLFLENCSSGNAKSSPLMLEHFVARPFWNMSSGLRSSIFCRADTRRFRKSLKIKRKNCRRFTAWGEEILDIDIFSKPRKKHNCFVCSLLIIVCSLLIIFYSLLILLFLIDYFFILILIKNTGN